VNPRRKKRLVIVSSIFLGISTVAGLVLYALSQNFDVFFTPSEIVQGKKNTGVKPAIGQRIRVGGLVVPGSVQRNQQTLDVSFDLIDQGPTVTVLYQGILPDLFREGQGILANGILVDSSTIKASEVLAKHDENYMPKEIADAIAEQHNAPINNELKASNN
jgi:cytochrome c-type biogenesis protein CcmE